MKIEELESLVESNPGIGTEELRKKMGVVNDTIIRNAIKSPNIVMVLTNTGYRYFSKKK